MFGVTVTWRPVCEQYAACVVGFFWIIFQVAASPFLIVIGTHGSQQLTDSIKRLAQYIANTHDMTTDTVAWIVNDTLALSNGFEGAWNLWFTVVTST